MGPSRRRSEQESARDVAARAFMTRILSASVLIGLVAATIWLLPPWATAALAAIAAAAASTELAMLAAKQGAQVPRALVAAASAVLVLAFVVRDPRVPG